MDEALLRELPEPQRQALDVALLRTSPSGRGADPRAVAAALLAVLTGYAKESAVLVAIDDVQWLDPASATAISFALRRIDPGQPVGVLAAVRIEPGSDIPVLGPLPSGHGDRVRLSPLSLSALYHVIQAELGVVFPRPTLQRIMQASGGNPYFAVELARALEEAEERPGPGEQLPVPDPVADLLDGACGQVAARCA